MAVGDPKGYYRTLGVARGASADEIRAAYRQRAKQLHPDQGGAREPATFHDLTAAYEVLRDPRRRLAYDVTALDRDANALPPGATDDGDVAAATRRGERPHRRAPSPRITQPAGTVALSAACVVLCLLLAVAIGVLWRMHAQLEAATAARSTQDQRYAELAAVEADLRGRHLAQTVDGGTTANGTELPHSRLLFSREITFQPGSAVIDRDLEGRIDNAVVELSRALRAVPDRETWLVVVNGYGGQAAAAQGVAVAAWETGLLRIGAVIDRLLAQGLPPDRIATRFQAGFNPLSFDADSRIVELQLVCCLRP